MATLVTGAAVALSAATPALAARGTLRIGTRTYNNPARGCYNSDIWPLFVTNRTNITVFVYEGANCTGHSLSAVGPGKSATFEFAKSVDVPG
ncbi:hypothetical protein [Actinomadura harenae]|uniref:hypothetical protein n=1 Tax=Actinomadura harenae TaxID=2483351 RepID=UPI0011C48589|nr:hypothetical protein [Actinomadura harenae]